MLRAQQRRGGEGTAWRVTRVRKSQRQQSCRAGGEQGRPLCRS